ncbi:MAG: hypothetical protein GEV03_14865 [Streptosporangiales bacterium]|nr:hypothetical protein [Streptosporangiales bacterium]
MRTTIFSLRDGKAVPEVSEKPSWQPLGDYDGKPLQRVHMTSLKEVTHAEMQLVSIAAGGHFAMHASPDVAFCQIVRGRGRLGLEDGTELPYEAPELYIFLPGTLHDWHAIEEDTVLSVCLVQQD